MTIPEVDVDAGIIVAMITSIFGLIGVIFTGVITLRVQRKMKTNHGSTSIGNAIDRLTEKVFKIDAKQELMEEKVDSITEKVVLIQLDQREHNRKLEKVHDNTLLQQGMLDTHITENADFVKWGRNKMKQEAESDGEAG